MEKLLQRLTVLIGLYVIISAGADVLAGGGSCLLNDPCAASGVGNCQCKLFYKLYTIKSGSNSVHLPERSTKKSETRT